MVYVLQQVETRDAKRKVHECLLRSVDDKKQLRLSITTRKDSRGGIITTASVAVFEDVGGYTRETHSMYEDYYKTLSFTPSKRVLAQHVQAQHADCVDKYFKPVLAEVCKQYALDEVT